MGEAKRRLIGQNLVKLGECNHRNNQSWWFFWRGEKVRPTQKSLPLNPNIAFPSISI